MIVSFVSRLDVPAGLVSCAILTVVSCAILMMSFLCISDDSLVCLQTRRTSRTGLLCYTDGGLLPNTDDVFLVRL